MSQFKPIEFNEETLRQYWEGSSNLFARCYVYLQRGLSLFNETKNYILMLFGTYWTVKTMDYWIGTGYSDGFLMAGLGLIASVGIGFLILIGRWDLFRLSKAREFATTQHGTITKYDGFNMNVRNIEQNDEIIKLLKKLK